MKRIITKLLGIIFIASASFSCTKEKVDTPSDEEQIAPEGYLNFSASIESGTKTTTSVVDNSSSTVWDEGDKITITVGGNSYTYVADQSGKSTTFSPMTKSDRIPRTEDDVYTLTASYGGEVLATQNIDSKGINDCLKPLAASIESKYCENGNIALEFKQTAALLDFKFAKEDMTLDYMIITTGGNPNTITVNFTDGLNLNSGDASAQVVIASLAFSAMDGVAIEAKMKDMDTPYRRIILLGKNSQDYKVGKHTRLNMSKFKGAHITKGADLRELALCINKGWNINHFLDSDNTIYLDNDIDISAFHPWQAIGNNNKKLIDEEMQNSYVLRHTFDGQSHTVTGLTINDDEDGGKLKNDYDLFGLFGIVNANISNLNVDNGDLVVRSSSQNVNLRAGGIAAVLMPGKTISNCTSNIDINIQVLGRDKKDSNDKLTATSADSHKWQRVGGIVGECRGIITDCTNNGQIKNTNGNALNSYNALTNAHYGGIAGHICNYGSSDVTISSCTNNGDLSWGGNCALAFVSAYSVEDTDNRSDDNMRGQELQGVSIGGIVGTAGHMVTRDQTAQTGRVTISGCYGKGKVELSNVLGCNAGGIAGRTGCDNNISITNCHLDFTGDKIINASTCTSGKSSYSSTIQGEWAYNGHNYRPYINIGGIVGAVHCTSGSISSLDAQKGGLRFSSNCYAALGGIIGFISHFSNGVTYNNLENTSTQVYYIGTCAGTNGSHIGGVIGKIARGSSTNGDQTSFVTVTNAVNQAYVGDKDKTQSRHSYGGIVGSGDGMYLKDCANHGTLSALSNDTKSWHGWIGGICGMQVFTGTYSYLDGCGSYGTISYDKYHIYRGFGLGEAECTRAMGCQYNSSNAADNVKCGTTGGSLTPLYAAGSDTEENAYYTRIGGKTNYWQWSKNE